MHDKGPLRSQRAEHLGHHLCKLFAINPDNLSGRLRRIAQRTQEVENGTDSDFTPGKHDIAHGSVKERSVEETNPRLVDTAPHSFGRKIYADTESFYHVGAPAQARHTAIPVFGHSHSCACHHEGCRRGNVEGPGCIPPCAACVYQHLSFGTRKRGADMRAWAHGGNATADDTSKAYQLLNSLPLHPQSREKGGDLRIGGLTAHQCFHDGLGLGPVQMVPFHDPPYGGDYLHGRIICEVTCAHSR